MPHTPIQIYIPDAAHIDYTNVDEVCGYQLLLSKIFELAGGFDIPLKTNNAIREVQKQGRIWLKNTKTVIDKIFDPSNLNGLTLAAIPHLLSAYDLLYRICNGTPIFDYIRKIRLKTADTWAKGNKTISQTDIAIAILNEADRDHTTIAPRYTQYAYTLVARWVDELIDFGHFRNIPTHEAYNRLTYLLSHDLTTYLGRTQQAATKSAWARTYTIPDNTLHTLDTMTLWHYIRFAQTASKLKGHTPDDTDAQYSHHFSILARRPDLNRFYREAITIDLTPHPTSHTLI